MSKLASLKSINETLCDLLDSDVSFVAQIAEVIRLDPSLTTRVLDLVNSIFSEARTKKDFLRGGGIHFPWIEPY